MGPTQMPAMAGKNRAYLVIRPCSDIDLLNYCEDSREEIGSEVGRKLENPAGFLLDWYLAFLCHPCYF
jgi:hypothetical protein